MAELIYLRGYRVIIFCPFDSEKYIKSNFEIIYYHKSKNVINPKLEYSKIAQNILNFTPKYIIFCDASIPSLLTIKNLKEYKSVGIVIHDVMAHNEHFSAYNYLKKFYQNSLLKNIFEIVKNIILLSNNSFNQFIVLYPKYKYKAILFYLFPHPPKVTIKKQPIEMAEYNSIANYYLFFGRITKYKGLKRLLKVYCHLKNPKKLKLIIAGEGTLTRKEKKYIKNSNDVVLINRFIENEEMHYLFSNSRAIILPYLEATQSGILPISYFFRKPVIVSNVPGLNEFVVNYKTGIIFSDDIELENALIAILDNDFYNSLISNIGEYVNRVYNEDVLIDQLLSKLKL